MYCKICKKEFMRNRGTCQKCCSLECSQINIRRIKALYKLRHKDKVLEQCRLYAKKARKKNSKILNERTRLWRLKNKEKVRIDGWAYRKNKLQNDINYKLATILRSQISKVLKHNSKSKSTIKLLGCEIIDFKQHLKSHFQCGMSWSNYGKWHIDHIRPCASFDLSKPSQQRKCFHYTNLQPLWAHDNLCKGKIYEPL